MAAMWFEVEAQRSPGGEEDAPWGCGCSHDPDGGDSRGEDPTCEHEQQAEVLARSWVTQNAQGPFLQSHPASCLCQLLGRSLASHLRLSKCEPK